ncbi:MULTISPECIES: TIR domain-containing protein [Mixta]|uniref:Nucleotide-binding protein n=1 Tax=Mixta hanseatica TaxID=2872648 RepID=A0ABY4RFG1_9GAMM|nr:MULTISPECIES: nucleotide-binding protein [Mixta]UQY46313.1 nucleotide-binding protein [Mixta hanseatica]
MHKSKEQVAEILSDYFTLCIAIVTEDSSDYQKHVLTYQFSRQQVLGLDNELMLPNWILAAASIPLLKSHVDLHVQGGAGSWARRRTYLHSVMDTILQTYRNPVASNFSQAMADAFKAAKSAPPSYQDAGSSNFSQAMADAFKAAKSDSPSYQDAGSLLLSQHAENSHKSSYEHQGNVSYPSKQPTSDNIRQEELKLGMSNAGSPDVESKKKVFIVHGHDELLKNEVYVFLSQEGYEPIILHLQANKGSTIIEKLEENIADVSFAVILYTACDQGKSFKEADLKSRARQNVVFEHGYLICKLGRERVAALKSDGVEIPGDLSGLITIPTSNWQYELLKELKAAN